MDLKTLMQHLFMRRMLCCSLNVLGPACFLDRSLNAPHAGNYDEYFGTATDIEAVVYMMIMNQTLHDLFPNIVCVGEDVSGMPTFSRYQRVPALITD